MIVKSGSQRGIEDEYAVMNWYRHLEEAAREGAISVDDLENWKTKLTKSKEPFLVRRHSTGV